MRRFTDEQLKRLQESHSRIDTSEYYRIIVDYELALRESEKSADFWKKKYQSLNLE